MATQKSLKNLQTVIYIFNRIQQVVGYNKNQMDYYTTETRVETVTFEKVHLQLKQKGTQE